MIPSQRFVRIVLGLLCGRLAGLAISVPPARAADAPAKDSTERAYDIHDFLWAAGNGRSDDGYEDTRCRLVEQITDLVRETVAPDAWNDGLATIRDHDGRLLVKAPDAIHAQLASFLGQLREDVSGVQGITLDCQFIIADEGFVQREFPEMLKRLAGGGGTTRPSDAGVTPSVRAIGPFKARQFVDAARSPAATRSGAVIVVPAVMPLYYTDSAFSLGREHALKLPVLSGGASKLTAARPSVEVRRLTGMSLSVRGAYDTRYVTLDLSARHAELDARPDGAYYEELEAGYRGTFTIERSGAFVISAPLIRARLSGVRESDGPAGVRREVVREPVAATAQPDPRRFMLLIGTARTMTPAEVTLLAGERAARVVSERETDKSDLLPALPAILPPKRPGVPPAPPPQPPDDSESTRAYNIAGLLLGSEPDTERVAARDKRLKRVLDAVAKETGERTHVRESGGLLFVAGRRSDHLKVYSLLMQMIEAQALRPQ